MGIITSTHLKTLTLVYRSWLKLDESTFIFVIPLWPSSGPGFFFIYFWAITIKAGAMEQFKFLFANWWSTIRICINQKVLNLKEHFYLKNNSSLANFNN